MASRLTAALSRDTRYVNVAGARVAVPWAPAALWLPELEYPYYVVQAMTDDEGREAIEDVLVEIPGAEDALKAQSLQLLKDVTGRARWWEGTRLAHMGADPDFMGRMVLAGLDPWQRTLAEWCAAALSLAVDGANRIERERFMMRLSFPPAGHMHEWEDGEDYDATAAGFADMPGMG